MTSFCQELLEYEIVAESRHINIDICNHFTDLLVIDLYSLFYVPLWHRVIWIALSFETTF